jgi:hypothetical protein
MHSVLMVINQHLHETIQIPANGFGHPFMAVRFEPERPVSPAFQGAVNTGISDFHLTGCFQEKFYTTNGYVSTAGVLSLDQN